MMMQERRRGLVVLIVLALGGLAVVDVVADGAREQVYDRGTTSPDAGDLPVQVDLPHPVSVKAALDAARSAGVRVLEVRLQGNGLFGGHAPGHSLDITESVAEAEGAFRQRFGVVPVVPGLILAPGTPDEDVAVLVASLAVAPEAEIDPRSPNLRGPAAAGSGQTSSPASGPREPSAGALAPQDLPSHFPSAMTILAYYGIVPPGTERSVFEYQVRWSSALGHTPQQNPDDFGLELGATQYNDAIVSSTPRPFCPVGAESAFWSRVYQIGTYTWGGNVPAAAGPYTDSNIDSDPCSENSVEVGIGYPRQLQADVAYYLFVVLPTGTQGESPFGASASLKSNDCNDVGIDPNTDCMGLNTERDPPAGLEESQLYVSRGRSLPVPGCAGMRDGWDAPLRLPNGVGDCPFNAL